ncbi:MAG: RsmE family RNA methyltransferase [Malacoplasma sp.]
MHRFSIKNNNGKIAFSSTDMHHIIVVLRKKINSILHCVDQNDCLIKVKLISIKPFNVEIVELKKIDNLTISNVNVFLGVIKKKNFELLIKFLNEMNVNSLTPVIFSRSQNNINYDKKRIETILVESCKQSNRIKPMIVNDALVYFDFLNKIKGKQNYFANEKEKSNSFLKLNCKIKEDINLIIGPEGGFTTTEINEISKISLSVSLGANILRSETAAIYMSAVFLEKEKYCEE